MVISLGKLGVEVKGVGRHGEWELEREAGWAGWMCGMQFGSRTEGESKERDNLMGGISGLERNLASGNLLVIYKDDPS